MKLLLCDSARCAPLHPSLPDCQAFTRSPQRALDSVQQSLHPCGPGEMSCAQGLSGPSQSSRQKRTPGLCPLLCTLLIFSLCGCFPHMPGCATSGPSLYWASLYLGASPGAAARDPASRELVLLHPRSLAYSYRYGASLTSETWCLQWGIQRGRGAQGTAPTVRWQM